MSMQPITKAWESAPEAALAALKLEPLYTGLSWFVQQELQRHALHLKGSKDTITQGMDRVVLSGTLSSDPIVRQAQIEAQIATQASRAQTIATAEARAALIKIIPAAQKTEVEARRQLDASIAAEQDLITRTKGKLPQFVESSERRIAGLIAQYHTTYSKPETTQGTSGLEKLPPPPTL